MKKIESIAPPSVIVTKFVRWRIDIYRESYTKTLQYPHSLYNDRKRHDNIGKETPFVTMVEVACLQGLTIWTDLLRYFLTKYSLHVHIQRDGCSCWHLKLFIALCTSTPCPNDEYFRILTWGKILTMLLETLVLYNQSFDICMQYNSMSRSKGIIG